MKKIVAIAAATALCLVLAGCGSSSASSSASSSSAASQSTASTTTAASASTSASSAATTSSANQGTSTSKWKDVTSPEEAAIGAGISTFGVVDSFKIGGNVFDNPSFSYVDGAAQATYETGAIGLFVRKSDDAHTSLLTDRSASEFPNTWTKSYEGLDVTLYGEDKDAATVFTWNDGTYGYGVTYQGLGGEEVTMTSSEVASIVKNIKAANVASKKQDSKDSAAKSESSASSTQSPGRNASLANQQGAYTDDEMNYDSDEETEEGMDEDQAVTIAERTSGGEYVDAEQVETDEYGTVWQVTTEDEEGNVSTYYVDEEGETYDVREE